jgi:hypothetical protein
MVKQFLGKVSEPVRGLRDSAARNLKGLADLGVVAVASAQPAQ